MAERERVVVWGAGSWGTALAVHLAQSGHQVFLWVYETELFPRMVSARENEVFLPGVPLPEGLELFNDALAFPADAPYWVSVVPTQHLRPLWERIGPSCPAGTTVISASKGIEQGTHMRPSEILEQCLPDGRDPVVVLSGPSFAVDLCKGDPTAVVFGCPDAEPARRAQRLFSHNHMRGYVSTDRTGVELGGALKNIMALACGIAVGLGFGSNAVAAIITRGLREMGRLGVALGARPETFAGLSGIGDLVLTCTGGESRNRAVGIRIGQGEALPEILASMKMVAEGVPTTRSVAEIAREKRVDLPITFVVERMLFEDLPPRRALKELLARELKDENA